MKVLGTAIETWVAINGYEGLYEVSDQGHVRSLIAAPSSGRPAPRILAGRLGGKARYMRVTLCGPSGRRECYIHSLVLEAFVGSCPSGMECRHLDGNRMNNARTNLAWGTKQENIDDKKAHGTITAQGWNSQAKLTAGQVAEVRQLASHLSHAKIAERFGVSRSAISSILRGRTWSTLPKEATCA